MAYAFSVSYGGRKELFSPPLGTSPQDIKEAVAGAFSVPIGSFTIRQDGVAGFFHAALRGDWQLVLIPCELDFLMNASAALFGFHVASVGYI
jgi:hypothetical protein